MITTLIIEDEPNVAEVLRKMLGLLCPNLEIIGETGSVNSAVSLIKEMKPKLVFMDIELEDGTGFDVLQKVEHKDIKVIFTTAYNQYAIKAFKFSAVDYLLKPINPEELKEAVNRATTSINEKANYEELLHQISTKKSENIVLKTQNQRYVIAIDSIVRLQADGAYTMFITEDKTLVVSKNIKYYQDLLDDDFIRCHQSHLVHKKHIKRLDSDTNLHLSNGDVVPVSRRNKEGILAVLEF